MMFLYHYTTIIIWGLAIVNRSGLVAAVKRPHDELDLHRTPGEPGPRDFLMGVYKRLLEGGSLDDASAYGRGTLGVAVSDTVRSIAAQDSPSWNEHQNINFRIPKLAREEQFHHVELRINTEQLPRVRTHMVVEIRKSMARIRFNIPRQKPLIHGPDTVWDVSSRILPWLNGYHGDIQIRFSYNVSRNIPSALNSRLTILKQMLSSYKNKAMLVLFSKDASFFNELRAGYAKVQSSVVAEEPKDDHRQRRETKRASDRRLLRTKKRRRLCQVKDFEVDFNVIGWGRWIVHPKRFNAKMCKGICPSPIREDLSPSNHAMLQGMMRTSGRGKKRVSMPCCVPTKLAPQSMLYYEGDEIVVRHHKDMVVEQCGCR